MASIVSAWTYNRRPVEIPFRTHRKPTRLTANIGTTIDVGQQLVHVTSRLDYHVEFAGVDTFRFQVPASVSGSVQIESAAAAGSPGIKHRLPADEAVDGWITWTVVMQQEVAGKQSFQITYDLKRDTDDANAAGNQDKSQQSTDGTMTVRPLRVLGLEADAGKPAVVLSAVVGEVVILKDRALAVSAEASGGDIELIDVRELRFAAQGNNAYLAYRYHKQPVTLTLAA